MNNLTLEDKHTLFLNHDQNPPSSGVLILQPLSLPHTGSNMRFSSFLQNNTSSYLQKKNILKTQFLHTHIHQMSGNMNCFMSYEDWLTLLFSQNLKNLLQL